MNFLKKILYILYIINTVIGLVLITLCIALYISLFSFLIHFNKYQNYNSFYELEKTKNFLGKIGAIIGDKFIYNGLGISSFLFPLLLLLIGLIILFGINYIKYIIHIIFLILLIPIVLSILLPNNNILSGTLGNRVHKIFTIFIGEVGVCISILFFILLYIIFLFKITPFKLRTLFLKKKN
ncbi:MAG: DNA translocase FtsK 4TM domain-containing protein [Candidatus Bostrichicola ureolyticus]|nr:MAG: DNA translocase FtsK 4TM domain-containing protein [Candidatus Bostrichicola ureolyticus]